MTRKRKPSIATLKILGAMLSQPGAERYGYELMKTTGLKSGTLYPILMRLHDRGFLSAEWRTSQNMGKPPRQAYRLTNDGLNYAKAALNETVSDKKNAYPNLAHER